jgi:hypothetical protein
VAIGWFDLVITPSDAAVRQFRSSWDWLVDVDWSPILFSVWGDVFLKRPDDIVWLNTGTGELTAVAKDEDEFRQLLRGWGRSDWFLPNLVASLHETGKRPAAGECFTYAIYPVFEEGKYVPENFKPVPAASHFGVSGDLHRQIQDLEDGATVRVTVSD